MALLFSEVTLTVDQHQVKFLASGTPKTAADLDGWTAYEDFMEKHPESDEIKVHVDSYLYGEEEIEIANPNEVAYFTMRSDRDANFLSGHCESAGHSDFVIQNGQTEALEDIINKFTFIS